METNNQLDGWMLLEAFCEKYGQRKATVHKWVHDGTWPRGEFYSAADGDNNYVHEGRAAAWLKENGRQRRI